MSALALGSRAAFVTSWAILLGYVSVVAFEAVALPQTVLYLFPDMQVGKLWTIADYDVYLSWAAVGIVAAVEQVALQELELLELENVALEDLFALRDRQ